MTLRSEIQIKHEQSIEAAADGGTADAVAVREARCTARSLSEGDCVDINDKVVVMKEKVSSTADFTLKELMEVFHDFIVQRIKCQKLVLAQMYDSHQGVGKMAS